MELNNYWLEVKPKYKLVSLLENHKNGEIVIGTNRETKEVVAIKHFHVN